MTIALPSMSAESRRAQRQMRPPPKDCQDLELGELDELTHDPRLFSLDQLTRMETALRNRTPGKVQISRDMDSIETAKVQAQLTKFFRQQRWTVDIGTARGVTNPPANGLVLFSRTSDLQPSTDELSVIAALEAGGIAYELRRDTLAPKTTPLQLNFSSVDS